MRLDISAFAGGRMPRLLGVVVVIAASAMLAACASTGGGSGGGGGLAGLFGGGAKGSANPAASGNAGVTTVQSGTLDPNYFLKSGYCPPVQILPGTESMVVYERGHDGDAAYIRTQGSITKTARECHAVDASTLSIKVGVAGRILAGPKGGAGAVDMPLRIAVVRQHDNSVVFSKVFPIKARLTAPEFSADYSQVFDQVVFKVKPDDRDLIVYVGFDEGKPKPGSTLQPPA
jgi:hypothetical protein